MIVVVVVFSLQVIKLSSTTNWTEPFPVSDQTFVLGHVLKRFFFTGLCDVERRPKRYWREHTCTSTAVSVRERTNDSDR